MSEFVLYGGKGGVGKTTLATASGVRSAREGDDTLVVSTDPAHSLADSLGTDVGTDPTPVRDSLWAVEVDPQAGVSRYQELFETLESVLDDAGVEMEGNDGDAAGGGGLFTSGVVPGSDELAALEGLATYLDTDEFDRVVFDTAPTGHTLRLLDLPEVMERGMETAVSLHEQVQRKVNASKTLRLGPLAQRNTDDPTALLEMRDRMEQVGEVLRDPERTTFRVVTIPETMAVNETERLVAQLREFDVPVGALVVNKVIEDPGDCERCRAKQAVQEDCIADLEAALPDLDVWRVPDQPGQVTGLDALADVAARLGTG
ncbi:MAG: ArsA family ATPase [Halorientalis sp.]